MKQKGCFVGGCLVLGVAVLAVALVLGVIFWAKYNGMVTSEETCNAAWADVETVLQRRFDLIPNLVNSVKGYAAHEKGVIEEVTRLRSQWGEAKTQNEKAQVAGLLEGALGRLMVVMENYPDLKANQNFIALQDELAGTENRISVQRQRYNEMVRIYNTKIRTFPNVIIARVAGFESKALFEAEQGAAKAPTVAF